MKISNSKKQLAKIIHENGGWRDGMSFSWYGNKTKMGYFGEWPPRFDKASGSIIAYGALGVNVIPFKCEKLRNWHQTILSRDEYFHLYPAPDADGWIEWKGDEGDGRPVDGLVKVDVEYYDKIKHFGHIACNVNWSLAISYRLHKPEIAPDAEENNPVPVPESKPSIEQLATDYRNARDYSDRKQQEADAAKADAEAKLAELVAAGKALGLVLSIAEPEPELVITDWRDLQVGDEVECISPNVSPNKYRGRIGRLIGIDEHDSGNPYLVDFGECAKIWCHEVEFVRRPAKGDANA